MNVKNGLFVLAIILIDLPKYVFSQDIHEAVDQGDFKQVRSLLEHDPLLVNTLDDNGMTPLHIASFRGNQEIAALLIKKGALVNVGEIEDMKPLNYAALFGHLDIVKLLVDNGAVIDARYMGAASSLTMAALRNHYEICEYLISKGANINLVCNMQVTPTYCPVMNNNKKLLQLFLDYKPEINYRDFVGRTPLQVAVINGFTEIASKLIEYGANHKVKDEDFGRTLFHLAAINGHEDITKILMVHKTEINERDFQGFSALDYAIKYGHNNVAKFLESKGGRKIKTSGYVKTLKSQFMDLDEAEAVIIKLRRGSWGMKTKSKFLIFGHGDEGLQAAEPSLLCGYITQGDIKDYDVYCFESIFQPHLSLYDIEKNLSNMSFVLNVDYKKRYTKIGLKNDYYPLIMVPFQIENMEMISLPAWGCSKGYYVHVDGLAVLWLPYISDSYFPHRRNTEIIRYLLKNDLMVDIVLFGSPHRENGPEWHETLQVDYEEVIKLNPRVMFPMGSEFFVRAFVKKVKRFEPDAKIYCAENPGDRFLFKEGAIRKY